jgi:hypothetical protein
MFNKYLWGLYLNSQDGKSALAKDISEFVETSTYKEEVFHHSLYCEEYDGAELKDNGEADFEVINLREYIKDYTIDIKINNLNQAHTLFLQIVDEGLVFDLEEDDGREFGITYGGGLEDREAYGEIIATIEAFTSGLHDAHPEYFVPYLFAKRFDILEKVFKYFSFSLKEVPGKLQKRERALYYLSINESLQAFRKENNLSPEELNIFLYDFSFKQIDLSQQDDLPHPSRVWFIIGGGKNGDAEVMESSDEKTVTHWSGNLETRRGDIILMWCTAPKSYIHSIWRALGPGFNDPYFYYFSMIRLGHQVKIPPISFNEIKNDPLLSQKPSVKGRFQGSSGIAFSVEEYNAILNLVSAKGFDRKQLPAAPQSESITGIKVENERDVEVKLLEPLLRRLNFVDLDWIRQMPVRMGRGERNYPDYVFGADSKRGEESAVALIECKYSINKSTELKDAFLQARSYALRLQAKRIALADMRGVWVFSIREGGFSFDHFVFNTWKELQKSDVLHDLSLLIGKRVIQDLLENIKK